MKINYSFVGMVGLLLLFSGCGSTGGNVGTMPIYALPNEEAEWIRNGEPIVFEGEDWVPQDAFDIFLDSEVSLVGVYREVQFFIDRADVRPYNRLYTKYGKNKFRIFKKVIDDKNNPTR